MYKLLNFFETKKMLFLLNMASIFFYALWASRFAELHIMLPGTELPLFVGELLFIINVVFILCCADIKIIRVFGKNVLRQRANKQTWSVSSFFVCLALFIAVKSLSGYFAWGQLAFRHAALFYYSGFALFAYYLYSPDYFRCISARLLLFCFLLAYFLNPAKVYDYHFMFFMFVVAFFLGKPFKIWKAIALLVFLLSCTGEYLIVPGRGIFLGHVAGLSVFCVMQLAQYAKATKKVKFLLCVVIIAVIIGGLGFFSDRNVIKTLLTPQVVYQQYLQYTVFLNEHKDELIAGLQYERQNTLYESNEVYNEYSYRDDMHEEQRIEQDDIFRDVETFDEYAGMRNRDGNRIEHKNDVHDMDASNFFNGKENHSNSRALGPAYGNMLWRIFVSQDIIQELWHSKNIFGCAFGKPFRSVRLAILNKYRNGCWSNGWQVGWIDPHNSYLHILYRGGLFGLFFLVMFVIYLWRLCVGLFFRQSPFACALLAIVVCWSVYAFFSVVFELPYYAIPFWFCFGWLYAFLFKKDSV